MGPRNRFDRNGENQKVGHECEEAFKKVLLNRGIKFRPADRNEQRIEHVDFVAEENGKTVKYEVKARKKLRRSDVEPRDDILWLEFYSVGGNEGWLKGKADFIAFEQKDQFLLVDRAKLLTFAEAKCDLTQIVDTQEEAFYKGYTRYEWNDRSRPRNDLMSIVWTKDIIPFVHEIITKIS